MTKFLRLIILIVILTALWCGVLWLGLPEEWVQGPLQSASLPSLIAVHAGPPLFLVALWKAGKRAWNWRVKRAEKLAVAEQTTEHKATQEAAKAAHQEALEKRRAYVECRNIWATAIAHNPGWAETSAQGVTLSEQAVDSIQGAGREQALLVSLQQVFELVLSQCEASPWLPVVLADSALKQEWIEQVREETVGANKKDDAIPDLVCKSLSDDGDIPDQIIELFEENPDLPAVILVGMDSPLADAKQSNDFVQSPSSPEQPKPGHAVVAMLLSRPGLALPEDASPPPAPERKVDPYTPFWERDLGRGIDTPGWGSVPPALRPAFLQDSPPIATLHRMSTVSSISSKRNTLMKQLHGALQDAFIHAGLYDLPLEDEKSGSDKQADEAEQKGEEGESKCGWLVHNTEPKLLGAITLVLLGLDCEIDPLGDASNLATEHGNVGAARGALMLARALVRTVELGEPVLLAEATDGGGMNIGLVRSV